MYLAENIRFLRKKNNLSQDDIAEKLGYKSYTTIQKWEMGISEPSLSKLHSLAKLFNIDINDITTKRLSMPETEVESNNERSNGVIINVLGRVAAGIPIEAIEEIIDTEEISKDLAATGNFFALSIHGDSMEPRIYEGDVVIVKQQDDAESGQVVIALINGYDATCKRLVKHSDGISLVSFNSKYEPMYFSNKEVLEKPVKIIGRVVELRGKF